MTRINTRTLRSLNVSLQTLTVALIALAYSSAFAAEPIANAAAAESYVGKIAQTIDSAINNWLSNGVAVIQKAGIYMVIALAGLLLVNGMVQSFLGGKSMMQFVADFAQPLIMAGIMTFAITAGFAGSVQKTLYSVATAFTPPELASADPNDSAPEKVGLKIAGSFAVVAINTIVLPFQNFPPPDDADAGLLTKVNPYYVGMKLLRWAFSALICIIVAVTLMGCGAFALGIVYVAKVLLALGTAVAPLFLPWILFNSTAFLFNGWLRFMLSAGLSIVVTFAMGGLLAKICTELATSMVANTDPTAVFVQGCGLIMVAILVAFMMWQVPRAAAGLISGNGTVPMNQITAAFQSVGHSVGVVHDAAKKGGEAVANTLHGLGTKAAQSAAPKENKPVDLHPMASGQGERTATFDPLSSIPRASASGGNLGHESGKIGRGGATDVNYRQLPRPTT